jgi:membrane-bound lytic murein transglycosylase D
VNKAIKRSGNAKNYWKIYYNLPKETRGYVPAFIAANYVMNFYQSHNIFPKAPSFPIITDTIMVNNYLHFNQVAEVIGVPVEQLRSLNPQYRRDIIPASKEKAYGLVLPQDDISAYLENESLIRSHRSTEFFPNNEIVNPQSKFVSFEPSNIKGRDKVIYTVRSGDNLGAISSWFRVPTSDLKFWNKINKNFIKAGQKLTIYVPEGQGEYFTRFNKMSASEKKKSLNRTPTMSSPPKMESAVAVAQVETPTKTKNESKLDEKPEASEKSTKKSFVYYTVRKGDNFWTIAKKFPGVSNHDIMKINGIRAANSLKVGQKLNPRPGFT